MKGINCRLEFPDVESCPVDLREKLRSDATTGKLFISAADLNGRQLKRLVELADEEDPERARTLIKAPSTVPADFSLTREQIKAIRSYTQGLGKRRRKLAL